jgi:predicted DNA-binding transcriptional regulator AlpA
MYKTTDSPSLEKQTATAIKEFDSLPDAAFVKQPVLQALFSCSDETIRRRVLRGELPKPSKFGRSTVWRVGDVRQALASLTEAA